MLRNFMAANLTQLTKIKSSYVDEEEEEERENLETLLTKSVYHILLVDMKVIQISLSNR
jgi:hypothetical protein